MFSLDTLDELLENRTLSLEKGSKLICGDRVRPVIYRENKVTYIEFESPFIYIVIEELGGINIVDLKRKVNRIEIGEKTITLNIDSFPDITRDR